MIRNALILLGLTASLGLVGWEVAGKEHLLATGDTLLLELAPRDPRSIMQGDYMTLQYAIARDVSVSASAPRSGTIIVHRDPDGLATYMRPDDGGPLPEAHHRLAYRVREGEVQIGTNAYFFEEGTADLYTTARYGEVRVARDGTTLLVGLRDAERRPLGVAAGNSQPR